TLVLIPEMPKDIPEEIRNILPFELPIKNRANLRAAIVALRKIYKFTRLPESYLVELEPLPLDPTDLNTETRKFFPITDRKELRNVLFYKRTLADYYRWEGKLLEEYF